VVFRPLFTAPLVVHHRYLIVAPGRCPRRRSLCVPGLCSFHVAPRPFPAAALVVRRRYFIVALFFCFLRRVGVLCCVVVRGAPRTPLLRSARPGRCARLGLLRRASWIVEVEGDSRNPQIPLRSAWSSSACVRVGLPYLVEGGSQNPPSALRSAWPLRLAFFCARACCVVS
jgi:hypothetical protein